jgi:hypothetical protein
MALGIVHYQEDIVELEEVQEAMERQQHPREVFLL